jgi:hypothetical protein
MSDIQTAKSDPSHNEEKFAEISISTTAGFFPTEGFDRVEARQKIEIQLDKAKTKLKIRDTAGWIATVDTSAGKHTLDITRSYIENKLSGRVEIDWGPSEGGGGGECIC